MSNDLMETHGEHVIAPDTAPTNVGGTKDAPADNTPLTENPEQNEHTWLPSDPIVQKELERQGREATPPVDAFDDADLKNAQLNAMANCIESPDDYIAERDDQESEKRGETLSEKRQQERQQRHERMWARVNDIQQQQAAEEQARLGPNAQQMQQQAQIERHMGRAEARLDAYEAATPGFCDWVAEATDAYGDITREAAHTIYSSPLGPQIIHHIYGSDPERAGEFVDTLNRLPQNELDKFVARMEGQLSAARHSQRAPLPEPKRVSSAPKPVNTVSGKPHSPGKSLEEMDYDTYKKVMDERDKKAGRRR